MSPLGCTSYWWWCALTRVSTCAAVNTCTKHKKQYSKGKLPIQYSKEGSDAKNKNAGTSWHYIPLYEVALLPLHEVALPLHEGGLPKHDKIRPSYLARPESVESPALQHPLTETLKDRAGSRLFPTISSRS